MININRIEYFIINDVISIIPFLHILYSCPSGKISSHSPLNAVFVTGEFLVRKEYREKKTPRKMATRTSFCQTAS
jgi:hypothetical protein